MSASFFSRPSLALVLLLTAVSVRAQSIPRGPEMERLAMRLHALGRPSVALVLSGGGAKGLAHIGVLDVLDSAHVPIDLIVGTSMGAAIGGLYAAGYTPKQLEAFAETTNWSDILDFDDDSHRTERMLSQKDNDRAVLSLRFTGFFHPVLPQAISSGERLTMLLNAMVINAPRGTSQDFIQDLRVPFIALATDIVTGNRRLITSGDLTSAMRASITLPLRFTPLKEDSAILVDGGLLSNIPVDVAKDSSGAAIAIASNTTAELHSREGLSSPWDVADQVITLMMIRLSRESLKRADVVITPTIEVGATDFNDVAALIESGRQAARAALREIAARALHAEIDKRPQSTQHGLEAETVHGPLKLVTYNRSIPDTIARLLQRLGTSPFFGTYGSVSEQILATFHNEGYTLARIDSLTTQATAPTLYVDEGRVGDVLVVGSTAYHPEIVLREFPISKDDIFRSQDAERGLRNLTSTGLFDFASLEILRPPHDSGADRTAPVLQLTVQERAPGVLRLGLFADNEYGALFSTELASENMFGTGSTISAKGGLGSLSRYGAITFGLPRILRSTFSLTAQFFSSYRDISVYQTTANTDEGKIESSVLDVVRESHDAGERLHIGGDIGRVAEASVEFRHERERYFSVRSSDAPVFIDHITAFKGELIIDSRNDRAFPHTGTFGNAYYEIGTRLLGADRSYTKIYGELEQAIPVSAIHTLIPRVMAGFGDLTLPRMEQFSLGGIESFYGLNEDESRGRQVVSASLTYQVGIPHALLFPTFASIRYDIGATWLVPETIKFEALVHGLGVGIGLKTPLGLAQFAVGENFRFSKNQLKPIDLNSPRFYFSIGSTL